jgi:malate permease and related proteins
VKIPTFASFNTAYKSIKRMNQANNVFLITLTIIIFGFLIKKLGYISEKEGKVISKFLMHTTFPALMLVSTVRIKFEPSLFLAPIIAFVLGTIMLIIAFFIFKNYPNDMRGILTMGSSGFNTGLFAFPIIEGIWGREGLIFAIMYDIGNIVVVFGFIYTIGSYFASKGQGHSKVNFTHILTKAMRSPPLQATIIGLIINALAIPIPDIAIDFLDVLAKGNKPLVLLLMGIYLSFALDKQQLKAIFKVLTIRYFCSLVAVLLIYIFISPSLYQSILIVCVVLPIGMTLLPFSDELNYDSRIAGLLVNTSLLISFALIWALVLSLQLV